MLPVPRQPAAHRDGSRDRGKFAAHLLHVCRKPVSQPARAGTSAPKSFGRPPSAATPRNDSIFDAIFGTVRDSRDRN